MIFGVQGEDADLLANEVASLNYDPKKIKDEMYTRRQLIKEDATQLSFDHPGTGELVTFDSPLPVELQHILDQLS